MPDQATLGFGVQFGKKNAGTFTSLGDLVDFTPPTKTRETKDATHHGVANRVRKYVGGMRDLGEAGFVLHFEKGGDTETALNADYMNDNAVSYTVIYPGGEEDTFLGFITELSPATPLDDVMKISGKIKLSGA